jgi:hypothetical protein
MSRDPLGKHALFSVAAPSSPVPDSVATMRKESLFSASDGARRAGTVVVECSNCGARSRLGWAEFVWRHVPIGLWIPWLRYSQYMVCPACERRTWLGVAWFS